MEKMSKPPGWGTDSLTAFLEDSYLQQLATFAHMNDEFQALIRVDNWFVRVRGDSPRLPSTPPTILLVRSHSAYIAACESAAAGRVVEAFVQNRVCLECAAYSLHIHKNPKSGATWLERVTHPEATVAEKKMAGNAVRKEFAVKKIRSTIRNVKEVGRWLEKNFVGLYELAIEFGAHPNPQSAMSSLVPLEDNTGIRLITRHCGDTAHKFALASTAESGICALQVLQEAFRKQFKGSGVSADLRKYSGPPDR